MTHKLYSPQDFRDSRNIRTDGSQLAIPEIHQDDDSHKTLCLLKNIEDGSSSFEYLAFVSDYMKVYLVFKCGIESLTNTIPLHKIRILKKQFPQSFQYDNGLYLINGQSMRLVTDILYGQSLSERDASSKAKLEIMNLERQIEELKRTIEQLNPKRESIKRDKSGYVYVLKVIGSENLFKIGRTKSHTDRLKTFSVKLPFEVKYECLIPCNDRFVEEAKLHRHFSSKRKQGSEFFYLDDHDIDWLKSQCG
jgi:hypothetical protein